MAEGRRVMPPEEKPDPKDLLLSDDELDALAEIDEDDIAAAVQWWDENASDEFRGALGGPSD